MGPENIPDSPHLFFRSLAADETGQATVEYILILSATVVGVVALVKGLLKLLDDGVLHMGSQLEKDLKTGRAPLSVWNK